MPEMSDPACASDSAYAPNILPPIISGMYVARCSGVPNAAMAYEAITCTDRPTPTVIHAAATSSRACR